MRKAGNGPVRLLKDKSRVRRRWRDESEGGREPTKELRSRKRVLRLVRPERSGMGPVSELFCRLRTLSWSKRVRVLGAKMPPRF